MRFSLCTSPFPPLTRCFFSSIVSQSYILSFSDYSSLKVPSRTVVPAGFTFEILRRRRGFEYATVVESAQTRARRHVNKSQIINGKLSEMTFSQRRCVRDAIHHAADERSTGRWRVSAIEASKSLYEDPPLTIPSPSPPESHLLLDESNNCISVSRRGRPRGVG